MGKHRDRKEKNDTDRSDKVDELINEGKETTIPESKEEINKREILIKASEENCVKQTVEYLKKCSDRVINKIYKSYEKKRKKEANIFLTDLFISQFADALGGLDAIEDPKVLTDELKDNPILKKDIESVIAVISPYIPLIGLFGGIAITGKHIYQHKFKNDSDIKTETGKESSDDKNCI